MKRLANRLARSAAVLMFILVPGHAVAATWTDQAGSASGPMSLSPGLDPVYFTETSNGLSGQYTLYNNTQDHRIVGFGVSNFETVPWVGAIGSRYGCEFGGNAAWCYGSLALSAANWALEDLRDGLSGQDIWGAFSNVVDTGDNVVNWYAADDGDLGPGDSWDGFLFSPLLLASQGTVILEHANTGNLLFGSGLQPSAVPLPAAAWMLLSGFVVLGAWRKRRSRNATR
ncbi:MAG: VPLPA-CTERM sorting domain-containing protein [Gammaproteobacteria bacterium]|nr:VPLPA-CTERM sorting domain-containing protein [Gammaproteobacteria bacterium]